MMLEGIFPPIPTPFRGGDVDLAALASNVDRWMATPLAGLVVLGSNGEAPFIDEDEADRVVEAVRARITPPRRLIVGAGRESTRATIAAVRRAGALGADAALVRTPSFFKPHMTREAFLAHYTAVADRSPVPVLLYNFTALTGVAVSPDAVEILARHGNIIGIKESGSDVARVSEFIDRTPADFNVLVGSATALYASLLVGARGAIVALASIVPDLCVQLYDAVRAGDLAGARDLQRRLAPLARLVIATHGVAGLKAALDLVGYIGGEPRLPLLPVSPDAVAHIRTALESLQRPLAQI